AALLRVVDGQDRVGGLDGCEQPLVLRGQRRRALVGGRAIAVRLRRLVTRVRGALAVIGSPAGGGLQLLLELLPPFLETARIRPGPPPPPGPLPPSAAAGPRQTPRASGPVRPAPPPAEHAACSRPAPQWPCAPRARRARW